MMKNILTAMLFFMVAGCSNQLDHKKIAQSDLSKSMNAIYFTEIFLEKAKDHAIDTKNTIKELSKEYEFTENTCDRTANEFCASYQHKSEGHTNGGVVICEYLGNWQGKDLVYRRWATGGSGRFTDIVICSRHGDFFKVHDVILSGDRAIDGMEPHPIYDEDGKIYFYASLSTDTLFEQAEIPKEEAGQSYSCYYVIGKCVYDLNTKKTEILGMNILAPDNNPLKSKIIILLQQTAKNGHVFLNKNEVREFLQKVKIVAH
ncbi:MAG: hypothetical protein LBT70_01185 [Holosporaceae bacterium]|jgi:hypothetical protein|nr:hypothetical protein [Holosporaceae bacterium]